jgi:hypothetical protein
MFHMKHLWVFYVVFMCEQYIKCVKKFHVERNYIFICSVNVSTVHIKRFT